MNHPETMGKECRAVFDAITSRRAVRAFLPDEIPRDTVEQILNFAARAPSGSNIQPWQVDVLSGAARDRLTAAIVERFDTEDPSDVTYQYYPDPWREPYLARRRATGWGLYSAIGIERHEKEKMRKQHRRNFQFFDAPIGLIFTIDRDLPVGSWLDCGMFLQNIMIAARGFGLDTCPQQAFAAYHKTIRNVLNLPNDRTVICGMALGMANASDPANKFLTKREPLQKIARFHE